MIHRPMINRILIIGGYGNFGSYIAKSLALDANCQLIIGGRSLDKARTFVAGLDAMNPAEAIALDISNNFAAALASIKPNIVIHTSGPFQAQSYHVAVCCINAKVHYIDLADGREFVQGIQSLQQQALRNNVIVISGASSVPGLTSAVIDHYADQFDLIDTLDYGITTAQKTTRGLATTAAILSYTGRQFSTLINGTPSAIFGWQNLRVRRYKKLGWRLLANCDIPDLALFPERYPQLKTIRFYAGLELPGIHLALWSLSWLVRFRFMTNLQRYAALLLKLSFLFDWLGSASSAFHMQMSGTDNHGNAKSLTFELTARSGDGPYIPCMPAILLTRKIAAGQYYKVGAYPCIGLLSLTEYLDALKPLAISWEIF